MTKKSGLNHKRKGGYVRKWEEVLGSPAYRDLSTVSRCLIEEFQRIYRPERNGKLSISTKNAAKLLKVSKTTAINAFHDLAEHGFIVLNKGELWMERRAREWRLTFEPHNGKEPTDDWQIWEPGKPVATLPRKKMRVQYRTRSGSTLDQAGPDMDQ